MPTFEQSKYCPTCKRNVSTDKNDICKKCGSKIERGTWSTRFRILEANGEKQKRLSGFKTKKEAQQGYIDYLNEIRLRTPIKPNEMIKFDVLYEEYKSFAKSQLKESSYYDLCSKCNLHILPIFKEYYVQDITPKILLNWQNTLTSKNYSYKYKRNLRSYLKTILNYAEKYYHIDNQLKSVDNFRNTKFDKEMLIWTPEEFNSFISKVDKEEYRAFFYALYYTGARKGEILATTWKDWDLTNNTLNINKSITKKVYGKSWEITKPKNQSSIRKISIPPILVEVMKEFKFGKENNELVFYGKKPLADSNIQRIQEMDCKLSNVKKIRIHDFRHSHASLLLSQGVSVVAVAKRLGHSNIEQTLNTYAHLMPQEDEILIEVLQNSSKN